MFGSNYGQATASEFRAGIPNPFKELPNISSLKVRTRISDPLLSKHFVSKKLEPEMVFSALSWRTKSSNRYMRIMHGRLVNLLYAGDFHGFWILALTLMSKSYVLRAVALRKWDINWHRNYEFSLIKRVLNELDSHIKELPKNLHIVRNYVDKVKPDGTKTYRPIGNPAYSARLFLYMWQCFLVMFVSGYVSTSQHAYFPGRGVVTALQELQLKLESRDFLNAWEFDLKGAFPSVDVPQATRTFTHLGLPKQISEYLEAIAITTVERVDLSPQGQLLPEPKFEKQSFLAPALSLVNQIDLKQFQYGWASEQRQFIDLVAWSHGRQPNDPKVIEFCLAHPAFPKDEVRVESIEPAVIPNLASDRAAEDRYQHGKMLGAGNKTAIEVQGYPQGANISPILFNWVFEYAAKRAHFEVADRTVKLISYADDFLMFTKRDEVVLRENKTMLDHGLKFNLEKSRPIVKDGRWSVNSFKFLGVTLHVAKDTFLETAPIIWEGTPRSGLNLLLKKDKLDMVSNFEFRQEQLGNFADFFNLNLSANQILLRWADGDPLCSLIPFSVIRGEDAMDLPTLQRIAAVAGKSKFGDPSGLNAKPESSKGYGQLPKALATSFPGSPKSWLQVPELAGMVVNRLHGGDWSVSQKEASRSLKPKAPRTWLELAMKTCVGRDFRSLPISLRNWIVDLPQTVELAKEFEKGFDHINHPDSWVTVFLNRLKITEELVKPLSPQSMAANVSIYNSSSYASLAMLDMVKNPKTYKISRKRGSFKI